MTVTTPPPATPQTDSEYSYWEIKKARMIRGSLLRLQHKHEHIAFSPTVSDLTVWLHSRIMICRYCQVELTPKNFGLDHITPVSRGGSNDLDNLQQVCQSCNKAKGSLTNTEFSDLLALLNTWDDRGKHTLARLKRGYLG